MSSLYSQPNQPEKRKVFISFHHADEWYRNEFIRRWGDQFIGTDVKLGDIDTENSDDYTKRLIQVDHIVNSSVVVAIYGTHTRKRKHVDWEISAGLNEKVGGHKGLVVLIVPGFPGHPFDQNGVYDKALLYPHLHPRTAENVKTEYADVYFWPDMYTNLNPVEVKDLVELASKKRESHSHLIENSHPQYVNNLP
ncbi:MAG: TIR domain-containing protein [Patescibacteria group bacterium]